MLEQEGLVLWPLQNRLLIDHIIHLQWALKLERQGLITLQISCH